MRSHRPGLAVVFLVVAVWAWTSTVRAQEEAQTEDSAKSLGSIWLDVEQWVSQPAGLDYSPATRLESGSGLGTTQLLNVGHGTEGEARYRLTWGLPHDAGELVMSYYSHRSDATLGEISPGQFIYGEILTHPLFAGYAEDGLADAFLSNSTTRLRDLHLDFRRPAFRSNLVSGDWFLGWRRVTHDRSLSSTYFAVLPDLPPLLPPAVSCSPSCPDLAPTPDFAQLGSTFEGRGPTVGLDLHFPLWKDHLVLESSLAVSILRGKTNASYTAINHLYTVGGVFYGPPYDLFDVLYPLVGEASFGGTLTTGSRSTTSDALDAQIGLRWRARKWLDVIAGFRSQRYSDVGLDLRPKITTITPPDVDSFLYFNVQEVTEVHRSATYEGFYAGLTFRLY